MSSYCNFQRQFINIFLDIFTLNGDFGRLLNNRGASVPRDLRFRFGSAFALHRDERTSFVRNNSWLFDERRSEARWVLWTLERSMVS